MQLIRVFYIVEEIVSIFARPHEGVAVRAQSAIGRIEIVSWAERSLKVGGFMLIYVPTSNQIEKLLNSLGDWKQIEIVEVIQREWQARIEALRPKSSMIGHTGFIVSARWNG